MLVLSRRCLQTSIMIFGFCIADLEEEQDLIDDDDFVVQDSDDDYNYGYAARRKSGRGRGRRNAEGRPKPKPRLTATG